MTEVQSKAQRRRFTAAYKKKILAEVDACKARGEVGALLRREGLYSSHIAAWRGARDRGDLARVEPKKRGPKAKIVDERDKEIAELRRQNARLEKRVAQTEALIEIQKKVAALLGNPIPDSDEKS
jgi:transposase-like protein